MIIEHMEQGSEQWFKARSGIPTASCFSKIVTSKGEPSKSAKDYMYQLAGERITGVPSDTYQNAAMIRGNELEPEARAFLEMTEGVKIEQVGIVYKDELKTVSCSPDGICGPVGYEIKCPSIHTHIKYLLKGKLPTEYVQQVQGSIFVTGLYGWTFMSYYPGLKPLVVHVLRDDEFIEKLDNQITKFNLELDKVVAELEG
jgi:putative phage-type endonuclease